MPSPHKVRFEVMDSEDCDGLFTPGNMTVHIETRQDSFKKMSEVLLHEMIHVLLYERNKYTNAYAGHDGSFKELADEVCKLYKFNRKTF
jgi:predicted SprT family Zn-dependent metalloprotease